MGSHRMSEASVVWVTECALASASGAQVVLQLRLAESFDSRCGDSIVVFEQTLEEIQLRLSAHFAPLTLAREFVGLLGRMRPHQVRIDVLSGVSADLARLALALGFETVVRAPAHERLEIGDADAVRWLRALLSMVDGLLSVSEETATVLEGLDVPRLNAWPLGNARSVAAGGVWGYQTYAIGRRDHELLALMQRDLVEHFAGCRKVLDLGCGTGVFLDLLVRAGFMPSGVERNADSVRYARALGLDVIEADALEYLERSVESFDGLYCSHFVEHLPIDGVERLIRACAAALRPNGVALFVFPDPESIRSQLLGFWRDPEHVRFYHPELVELIAETNGLVLEYSSARAEGRAVVPFSMAPIPAPTHEAPSGWWQRCLARMGVASSAALGRERAHARWLEERMKQLWTVNQTWAWNDNAVLRMRKRDDCA